MKQSWLRFWRNERGAVAPTVALALFALIAAGGVAFDYARMATLDTELQDAADQAALAAAGQLDQQTGARTRAISAAQDLVANLTLMANDGSGVAITVPTVEFYKTYNAGRADIATAPGTAAATDAEALYVRVTVASRRANFAFTPVVAAFSSGQISARALAGVGSAICNFPPLMICNPVEGSGQNFDANAMRGHGLKLVTQGGNGAWAPGNFGYLDDPMTDNGTPGVRASLGWNSVPGGCSPGGGVETETGVTSSVTDGLNTRFDIQSTQGCPTGGTCSPALSTVTDLVRPSSAGTSGNDCFLHPQGFQLAGDNKHDGEYVPTSATPLSSAEIAAVRTIGHPRDICHTIGSCGQVGDGTWDRNAYFQIRYVRYNPSFDWRATMTAAGYNPDTVTRYQVYQWEQQDPTNRPGIHTIPSTTLVSRATPICVQPGIGPPTNPDRRKISAAIVNCTAQGVQGNSTNIHVQSWVDLFLVEPSVNRANANLGNAGDIYVEVIGPSPQPGTGNGGGSVIARNVPRLLE